MRSTDTAVGIEFTIAEKAYRCWVWATPWSWPVSPRSLARLMRMTDVQQPPPWKFWLSILFCFLQVVVGLLALGYLMLRGFGCAEGCAAAGFGYALYGFAIFGFAVALASIVLLFLLNKRTWAWTIPGVAILVIIIGFFVTNSAAGTMLAK